MTDFKKRRLRSGYVVLDTGEYEHRVIAKELIGRELQDNEEVHHLDRNKSNNTPSNLIVLEKNQHAKLHKWLDKNIVIPKPKYILNKSNRCLNCEKPIEKDEKYCSDSCYREATKKNISSITDKDMLIYLIKNNSLVKVGKILGISDNGVRKRCVSLGIDYKKIKDIKS